MNHLPPEREWHIQSPAPLGDGFDAQDRQLDEQLGRALSDIEVPTGLSQRIFSSSLADLHAGPRPLPMPAPRRSLPMQWLGMAACLGLLIVGGWWILSATNPVLRSQDRSMELVEVTPQRITPLELPATSEGLLSAEAEMVLLATASDRDMFRNLSPYITTRDLRFDDFSGDLVAVLDAMQNPTMQAYDLELRQ